MPRADLGLPSAIPKILAVLKTVYRQKGLRYSDIAKSLALSEVTVKRYMRGRSLTVEMLEKLCAVANLNIFELLEAVRRSQEKVVALSYEQEEALAAEPFLSVIFYLLHRQWGVTELSAEFSLPEWEMT